MGHSFGNRDFPPRRRQYRGVVAAVIGETWHNNHHARPGLAQTRQHWWQLDMAGDFIRILDSVGLARNVRYVNSVSEHAGVET